MLQYHFAKDVFMTITIEDASVRYLEKLYEIEKQCFETEAFTKSQIARLLTDYNSIGLIARADCGIVGFVIGSVNLDRNSVVGHVLTVDVLPAYRRRGVGQKLLQEIEQLFKSKGAKSSYLEVREDNVPALQLYEKCGYKKAGQLKNYYGRMNGVYLRKSLT
jgi:ribosomal-protein-alanine N-acetyltransferase